MGGGRSERIFQIRSTGAWERKGKLILTRAYFTAATCAISLIRPLSVNTPSKFFSLNLERPSLLLNSAGRLKEAGAQGAGNIPDYRGYITTLCCRTKDGSPRSGPPSGITIWAKPLGVSSMFKKSQLTKEQRDLIRLTPRLKSILIGMLLSDGWLQKRRGWNPRIGYKQSIINFSYIWTLFNELSVLCGNYPYLTSNKLRGKVFYSIQFETRQLSCLLEIYNLLYETSTPPPTSRGGASEKKASKKTINLELVHHLDYLALAHWIMGDGAKRNKGITLCTDGFTLQEVVRLINIIIIKFNINPTIHKEKNNYRIYINEKDLKLILPFIKPHFIDSFLYKIGGPAPEGRPD